MSDPIQIPRSLAVELEEAADWYRSRNEATSDDDITYAKLRSILYAPDVVTTEHRAQQREAFERAVETYAAIVAKREGVSAGYGNGTEDETDEALDQDEAAAKRAVLELAGFGGE
jgi:hypothetical protein